jgi:predicted MFS family arabinose efflux permease
MLFVVLGAGGLLWLLPWIQWMPRVEHRVKAKNAASLPSIARLLRMKCAWGAFFGHFCGNYFFYFLLAWLPNYLASEEKMAIGAMSRVTAAAFLVIGTVTLVTGWVSDRLIAAGHSPTRVRRAAVVGGLSVASSLLLLGFVPRNPSLSLAIIAVACIGYGAFASNHWAITQTLAGSEMAGRWSSLQNGVANLSGIVAPWVSGLIMQVNGSSRMAFVVAGGVALAGACFWGFLVTRVEPVQWGTLDRALEV